MNERLSQVEGRFEAGARPVYAPTAAMPATMGGVVSPLTVTCCEAFAVEELLALAGENAPAVNSLECTFRPPAPLSLELRSATPAVRSFQFAPPADERPAWLAAPAQTAPPGSKPVTVAKVGAMKGKSAVLSTTTLTRVRPPQDVVKLEDRLQYLLQPPLETWLSQGTIELPCQPFPYQLEGIAFLLPRESAVLADEMGLGKTMQAITAVRLLLHAQEARRVLLVCPKPLVSNWCRELARWAPEVPVTVIEGDPSRRRWQWHEADAPLKIANYEVVNRDRDWLGDARTQFDLVLLDESQRIKNPASGTAQAVRSIRRRRSWALTGTPVENSAEDLVGIFEFLAPGYLSRDMKLRRMGRLAGDYVLRRTKDQVLRDLPPKLFREAEIELTAEQRESYRLAEEEGVLRLNALGSGVTIQHVFELVLRLKQICNFDPATGSSAKYERLAADLEEVAASGRKAIIFSQWVSTLRELSRRLEPFGVLEYHGQVPQGRRGSVLETFQHDPRRHVLLMSYGTGGVGLNLQFAGYVFLYDRWWNPAIEDQAINRAHRIGAAGPVTVTRFLALDTIEQRIDQVLRDKRAIFDAIFSEASLEPRRGLSRDDIFGLFQLRSPQGPLDAAA